jgi:hypothetical protein
MQRVPNRGKHQGVPAHVLAWENRYVIIAGEIAAVAAEREADDRKIDHVWIDVRAGEFGCLQIALSTCSRQNRAAGFDPRVRLGLIESIWTELPPAGVRVAPPLNYAQLEATHRVHYNVFERAQLEELLVEKARRAMLVEAWGEFYVRSHIGVHQVHSRRASFAVPRDEVGHDGALRFYFREANLSEMLLFKFAGQP